MIQIDQELCIGCGQCLEVCASRILTRREDGKVENPGKSCIECLHCGGMCPAGAISYDGEPVVKETIDKIFGLEDLESVERALYQRRSYRIFQDKEVPDEWILRALQAADWGASASNTHPLRWIVVKNAKLRDEVMDTILNYLKENHEQENLIRNIENGYNPVVGINGTLLIAYCAKDAWNPEQDTAIGITNAELVLQAAGIGTCWGGFLRRFINRIPGLKELLHIPEDHNVHGTLMIGYPDQTPYRHVPERRKKADVTFL